MNKKRILSILLVTTLLIGCFVSYNAGLPDAASKAKLKTVKVSLKENKNIKKQGNTWYIVKGTKTKLIVTPVFNRKIKKVKSSKTFKSSKPKILQVSKKGIIKAKRTGKAVIKVTVKTKKTKKVSRKKKSKKLVLVCLTRKAFDQKFKKKQEKPAVQKPKPEPKRSMQEILDEMTDENGTLTLTEEFLKNYGYIQDSKYNIPTEFTKATKVIIPEIKNPDWCNSNSLRTDVIYCVPNSFDCTWNYTTDTYNFDTIESDNQLNIRSLPDFYAVTKKGVFQDIGEHVQKTFFYGWDGGITRFKIQSFKTNEWKTFRFEVYNPDYNSLEYKKYTAMKDLSKEALKGCHSDLEKVKEIIKLIKTNKIGDVYTYTYHNQTYATLMNEYCNINGIPCTDRDASYDKPYGQGELHTNNLILLDGTPYIVDAGLNKFIPYKEMFNDNCRYLYDTSATGENLQGRIDMNLKVFRGNIYKHILDQGGYDAPLFSGYQSDVLMN